MVSCDEAIKKFDKYVWAVAHKFARNLRGYDVCDLHQEGLIKLYEVYTSAANSGKPDAELDKIFKTSLSHRFIDIQREQFLQDHYLVTMDLEEATLWYGEDAFAELNLRYCQEYLAHFVSSDAALLLDLLVEPSTELLLEFQLQTMRREHIKQQGFKTLITNKIPHRLAGKTLGFGLSKTKNLIRELQHAFMEHMCSAHSYKLNKAMC